MKPFTLEWWLLIKARFVSEFIEIRDTYINTDISYSSTYITPEMQRNNEIREIIGWINQRIINKYGEQQ